MPMLEMGKTEAQHIFCHDVCWRRTGILNLILKHLSLSPSLPRGDTHMYMKKFHMHTSCHLILGGRDCITYIFKNVRMLQITFCIFYR